MTGYREVQHPGGGGVALFLPLLLMPLAVGAQGIGERVASVDNGKVRMTYAARPNVCGNAEGHGWRIREDDDWTGDCDAGPVHLQIEVRAGRIVDIDAWMGGRWRGGSPALDLGRVGTRALVDYLLTLDADDAIFPAVIADSVTVWPRLLVIARDSHRPERVRQQAIFWVAQAAGDSATAGLAALSEDDPDREVRKHAVFALSQIRSANAVEVLIRIARTNRDPEIRRTAIFWLGQSRDPRAIDYFEEVLRG